MEKAKYLAERIGSETSVPRQCKRQTLRNNTPATSVTEYYKRSVLIPFWIIFSMNLIPDFQNTVKLFHKVFCSHKGPGSLKDT